MSDFVITHISIPRPHTDIIKQVYITEVQEALPRADGSKVNNVATEMRYVTDFYYGCKKLHCICACVRVVGQPYIDRTTLTIVIASGDCSSVYRTIII